MLFDRLKTQKYSSKSTHLSDINSIILSIAPSQPVKNVIVYTAFTYYSVVWSQLTSCSGSHFMVSHWSAVLRGSNRIKESEKVSHQISSVEVPVEAQTTLFPSGFSSRMLLDLFTMVPQDSKRVSGCYQVLF